MMVRLIDAAMTDLPARDRVHPSRKNEHECPKSKGEKRPADVIGNAFHVFGIATGVAEEDYGAVPKRAKGGRKRGKARARKLRPSAAFLDCPCSVGRALEEGLGSGRLILLFGEFSSPALRN